MNKPLFTEEQIECVSKPVPFSVPLALDEDHRGYAYEPWRWAHEHIPVAQVTVIHSRPGVIRGWFRREKCWEQFVRLSGDIQLVLWHEEHEEAIGHFLSDRNLTAVVVPPEWWRGWQCLGPQAASMLVLSSRLPEGDEPDVEFQPPHHVNSDVWIRRDG